jgi:uncharacterized protein
VHRSDLLNANTIRGLVALVCVAIALALPRGATAVDPSTAYNKFEYRIPMRDGAKLYTAVYVPKETIGEYPILLCRTRYGVGHYGADSFHPPKGLEFVNQRYIVVKQEVRGSFQSEGEFIDMTPQIVPKRGPSDVDQSTDCYDTIDWLVKNVPHNNGRVGLWGISYDGFFAAAGMIDAHPALVAVSPQAPQTDWFGGDDLHMHGAFILADTVQFISAWGRPRPQLTTEAPKPIDVGTNDGYRFWLELGALTNVDRRLFHGSIPSWSQWMAHGSYDEYWKARNILPHLREIRPAVMNVGGWYDANNLYGTLHAYRAIEKHCPGAFNILEIGPWYHSQWDADPGESLGEVSFGSQTTPFYRETMELPFFDACFAGRRPELPEAYVFETGGNRWRTFAEWPPKNAKVRALYLRENGGLSFESPPAGKANDEYVSDPAKPVPFIERRTNERTADYMIQDQRFAGRRPDVLVYRSEPLAEEVTVAGPICPQLWVSTTGTDADWVVKLIDVYPDDAGEVAAPTGTGLLRPGDSMAGYEQLVRGELLRGKFRNSLERPEPFEPGKRTVIEFEMLDVLHKFRKGHRIMIQIQSSWFPLVDRNPQTFVDIYNADASDFRPATHRVYRSEDAGSRIEMNVLP